MSRQLKNGLMIRLLLLLLFAFGSVTATAKERITYFHNDLLGSPVAATNAQGEMLWQEEYTAYGKRLIKTDQGRNSRWFTGKSEAAALGIQYFDARWYDAELGRFLSIDPVDYQEGDTHSFNRYAYANNNPYRYVDPNGESPLDVGFLIVDVVKLGVAVYSGEGVNEALVDVGMSAVGVLSPVPGTGVALKSYRAAKMAKTVDKAADVARGAKRGPKTDPNAPHNAKIREVADQVEAEGGTIVAGGGRLPEQLVPTPGGSKSGRRPDILYKDCNGILCGVNVGRTKADGSPVKREQQALDDLNGAGLPTRFERYD